MQISAIPDLLDETTSGRRESPSILSIESQLKLRSLYQFVDFCRGILDEVRQDTDLMQMQVAAEKLERLCVEADSWGFNALYEIASSLQLMLMNAGERAPNAGFPDALHRGLRMLSALLDQCESDFRWRLATADTLDCIKEASEN